MRERLDRVRRSLDEHHAERILALGKDFAAYLAAPYGSADHCDRLSDERGQYVLEHAGITAGALLEGLDEMLDEAIPEHYGEGYFAEAAYACGPLECCLARRLTSNHAQPCARLVSAPRHADDSSKTHCVYACKSPV